MADDTPSNRRERRARDAQARQEGTMTELRFMEVADRFIDLANRENRTVEATDLHMIMAYAAARYSAHVAKNVIGVDEHEPFVADMAKSFTEMLRNHLADPEV